MRKLLTLAICLAAGTAFGQAATRPIAKDATSQSVVIRIVDATDGTPETAVEHNTSGIDLKYRREGAANVDIVEAALTALTDAYSEGGIEHIGNGYYRLDVPNGAFATGVDGVLVHGTVTGMVVIGAYVPLVDSITVDANGRVAADVVEISGDTVAADNVETAFQSTLSEPTGVPAADAALWTKLSYLYMALRNQVDVTATKKQYYDDGGAVEWEKDLSDDGTTYSETEGNAP